MARPARSAFGSSPLTRGKHAVDRRALVEEGLIPAHAGKTAPTLKPGSTSPAHPRSRGENISEHANNDPAHGSSPLTRGKPGMTYAGELYERLIPAHAGKTFGLSLSVYRGAAHPRSRGENHIEARPYQRVAGSSPLTRGKHFLTCAFTAQIDQILETLELAASFGSYLIWVACATDAPQDPVRSIGLVLPSSMGAS